MLMTQRMARALSRSVTVTRNHGIRVGPVIVSRKGFILLPAAGWVIISGIVYMTAWFWYIVHSMSCSDCSFRGVGDGGNF